MFQKQKKKDRKYRKAKFEDHMGENFKFQASESNDSVNLKH